jgi:hypothetical protein
MRVRLQDSEFKDESVIDDPMGGVLDGLRQYVGAAPGDDDQGERQVRGRADSDGESVMQPPVANVDRERLVRGGLSPMRRRRPGWAALAVMLMVTLGVLGGYLYLQAGAKTSVVVMAGTVPAGHVITRADLSTVGVAGGLTTVAANDLGDVVGRRAAVTLLAGTVLQRSMLSSDGALQPGQAHVGLAVTSGQVPADGLKVGETVEVLQIPGTDTNGRSADPAQVMVPAATVWAARSDPARSGGMLLTVTVPSEMVSEIVSASGAGHVAVARVAAGS